jgi:hypothetical protein
MPAAAMLELGTFALFNIMAFGFLIYGGLKHLPMSGLLHLVSMVIFFGLAFMMFNVEDIGTTNTITDGSTTWTDKKIFMADQETDLLIWIYMGLATISLLSFMFTRALFKIRV